MKFSKLIFENLYSVSCSEVVIAINRQELLFNIGHFYLHIFFDIYDADKYNDIFPPVDELNMEEWLGKYDITKVTITCEEPCDEGDYLSNTAYYNILAFFLRHINSAFPKPVDKADVGYYEYRDDFVLEPNPISYGFIVDIDKRYWNDEKFYNWLMVESKKTYLTEEIKKIDVNIDINDDINQYSLNIAPNSLKVRRLGYLKIILLLFKSGDVIPELKLLKEINNHVEDYAAQLKNYKNTTGLILASKTGSSLKPYMELGQRLKLINKNLQLYQIGKTSKAYLESMKFEGNVFELTMVDKIFFLESLLSYDFVYIFNILYYAFTNECCSYSEMKADFQNAVINFLDAILNNGDKIPLNNELKIRSIRERISNWQKPEIYIDHILIPRLNWLYDLDLVDLKKNWEFRLTEQGKRLLMCLINSQDITHKQTCDIKNILKAIYMRVVNKTYNLQYSIFGNADTLDVDRLIDKSFSLFKTLAGNRVTLSVLTTYIKLQMMEQQKVIVDADDIEKYIKKNNRYILKFQSSYGDGYIQKR